MDLNGFLQKFKPENEAVDGIRGLEGTRPDKLIRPDFSTLLENLQFIKIESIGSFWDENHPEKTFEDILHRVTGLLVGMAATGSPLVYVLKTEAQELAIYFGAARIELLKQLVSAQIPGCQFKVIPAGLMFKNSQVQSSCFTLIGNPGAATSQHEKMEMPSEKIDQLIRGLGCQKNWNLLVIAQPFMVNENRIMVQKWGTLSRLARQNFKPSESARNTDRLGEHYVDLLENQFQRALEGQGLGNWQTQVYVTDDNGDAAAIAASVFCDTRAQPEVVKSIVASENGPTGWHWDASTWLNSRELAYWMQVPIAEYPGFQVQAYARFDVAIPDDYPNSGISLGMIQDVSNPSGQTLFVDPDELTGHILVAGTTNSGKTNTTFHLLEELTALGISFLVIEPTKGEYRFLKKKYPGLRLYTMGSPEAPLKINPFYVPRGVPVQMHLDYLLSLFSASFVLYAPMPYVLESALHEVYADRGWDLINDVCIRDLAAQDGSERNPRSFPTLTDLLFKVEEVTEKLGYDDKISADVKAALHARINSLRVGNKGTMLDTQNPFDFKELMNTPTVIEMGSIGDDEQKAFLIGLLLTRLYEQNIGSGIQVGKSKLRHVTVIEEAHRLLQNAQAGGGGGDFANPRGKAVETFCNLITEIRAYGEGFIIVEQSPVKLAPDVVKNTNFKLIHRITSADDRQSLAQVMNLDEKMQQMLVGMPKGNAIAFAGGMDHPMRVKYADKKKEVSQAIRSEPVIATVPVAEHQIPSAARLAEEYGIRLEFARWFLTVLSMGSLATDENWARLRGVLVSAFPLALKDRSIEQKVVDSVVPTLATWLATGLGRMYLWSFEIEEQMEKNILDLWNHRTRFRELQTEFARETAVGFAPYQGCRSCSEQCTYRFFVNLAFLDKDERDDLLQSARKYIRQPVLETRQDLMDGLKYQSDRLLDIDSPAFQNLKICFFAQTCERIGLHGPALEKMAKTLEQ